jgi:hypothetical protein
MHQIRQVTFYEDFSFALSTLDCGRPLVYDIDYDMLFWHGISPLDGRDYHPHAIIATRIAI